MRHAAAALALALGCVLASCSVPPQARVVERSPSPPGSLTAPPAVPAPAAPAASPPSAAAAASGADAGGPVLAQSAPPPPPAPDPTETLLALSSTVSTSVGGPSSGHLLGGVALPDSGPGYVHNTERPSEARYGTVELVQAIVRAAAIVDHDLPGSVLVVNDLGLLEGGPIRQHGSHQAGRDADILFYSLDAHDKPLPSVGVPIDPKGKGWDFKDLTTPADDQRVKLDAPRTWRFVQALLEVAPDSMQRIFIVEHVREMLLAQAAKAHAPKALVQRFADLTCQPDAPHDDHLHVRLYCTPEDIAAGCEDSPPIYPWRTALLKALGVHSVIASAYKTKKEQSEARERITTPAQAKKRAGKMDARVLAFLAEREAWLKQPHPGRPYCR